MKKYYGRTNEGTDGSTDRCKPVYAPLFQMGSIIIAGMFGAVQFLNIFNVLISTFLCVQLI